MKNFKRIIIALIVACVIITSCPISESIVDAATIKVKSGANVTEVKGSGKKYVAYRGKQAVKPKKGWYKKGSTQYYFDGKKNYATYVWYKKSDKWYLKKWNKSKKAYEKYTGTKQLSNGKIYYFKKGKKANGIVKKSGKYCYYKGGKQTAYSTSKGAWKKVSKTTKVYFDKGNKSATYAMYKNTLKKWNKTTKTYVKYTGKKRLDDNKIYYFNKGKKYTGARKGANGKFYKCKNGKNTSTLASGTMVYTDGKCYSFKNGEKVGKFTGINGGKYYKNGIEQSVAAGTEVIDNGKRLVYSDNKWIALTGKGSDNCFYVKGVKANGIHEFDNVYYSCKNGEGTKLDGIQKTGGKYYHFSKGIKGDAVDGITLIESKYYVFDEGTKGEAADGIKKLDGYYYKFSDGAIATLKGWNGKHYYNKQYQITYKKDDNLVYKITINVTKKSKSVMTTVIYLKNHSNKGRSNSKYDITFTNFPNYDDIEVVLKNASCYFENAFISTIYSSNIEPSGTKIAELLGNLYTIYKVISMQFSNLHYLTPLRVYPQGNYSAENYVNEVGISGENTPSILASDQKDKKLAFFKMTDEEESLKSYEGNTWGDRVWGTVNGVGANQLGIILMKIRDEIRESNMR